MQRPTLVRLLAAGAVLGLAQAAGFPGLILYPILAVVTAATLWSSGPRLALVATFRKLLAATGVSLLVLWAVYGFEWGHSTVLGISVPAPYHWDELFSLFQRLGRQDLAYLNGEVYRGGRWQFFLTAGLVKTPLPILILAVLGLAQFIRHRQLRATIALWLFPAFYFATALVSSLNIGYRHIMPVLPFLYIWGGAAIASLARPRLRMALAAASLAWLILGTSFIHPYYLAYFNEIAGGPLGGSRFLVVSDLDWGQDLVGLQDYVQENGLDPIYLSYFGTTPPEHYDIGYQPLPAWPPRGIPGQSYFHPDYPLPGVYAISLANLVGARFEGAMDTFAWFWDQEPIARIGYSIDLYEVPRLLYPDAAPVDLVLAGTELAQLPASIIEDEMHTNDLRPRWIDIHQGLVLPPGKFWLLRQADDSPAPALTERFLTGHLTERVTEGVGTELLLERLDGEAWQARAGCEVVAEDGTLLTTPLTWDPTISLIGYEWVDSALEPAGALELLTYWEVQSPTDSPLTMFAHLLDKEGQLLAQYDGVGVSPSYWRKGDRLVQLHTIPLPSELPSEVHGVSVGLYNTDMVERLTLSQGGDHVFIPFTEECALRNVKPVP